jgi:hypothetical protein
MVNKLSYFTPDEINSTLTTLQAVRSDLNVIIFTFSSISVTSYNILCTLRMKLTQNSSVKTKGLRKISIDRKINPSISISPTDLDRNSVARSSTRSSTFFLTEDENFSIVFSVWRHCFGNPFSEFLIWLKFDWLRC